MQSITFGGAKPHFAPKAQAPAAKKPAAAAPQPAALKFEGDKSAKKPEGQQLSCLA